MIENGKKYLVTTDAYFVGPDGQQYRAAWGKAQIIKVEDCFGFIPQKPSTNWFLKIGREECHIIIAGFQVHYTVRCEERPTRIEGKFYGSDGEEHVLNRIYFAE